VGPAARRGDAGAWPARLHALLGETPAGAIVAEAAAARIADPDPAVRARAIGFFAIFPLPVGIQPMLDALERGGDPAFWSAVAPVLDRSERARELAREEVLRPGRGAALYAELMARDGPWMLEHAAAIARASPELVPALLDAARRHHEDPHAVVARVGAAVAI
jgi:hypothetical protein